MSVKTQEMLMMGSVCDPFFDKRVSLLHMNVGPTFIDVLGKIWTATGAQIVNSQYRFGGTAGDNNSGYISTPSSPDFNFGTGDFIIEFWSYLNSLAGFAQPIDYGYVTAGALALQTGNADGMLNLYLNGSIVCTESSPATVGIWQFYEISRIGSTCRIFRGNQGGTAVQTASGTSSASISNSDQFRVLGTPNGGGHTWPGLMDDVRITKGTADQHSASFAVPFGPFPNYGCTGKYYRKVATYNPVGVWHLQELSSNFEDFSGNNNYAITVSGGLTRGITSIIPSETSSGVMAPGGNGIADRSLQIIPFSLTQSVTILCPINCAYPGSYFGLFKQGSDGVPSGQGCLFYITSTGQLGWESVVSGSFNEATSGAASFVPNTNVLVAVTVDMVNNQVRFYSGGVNIATVAWVWGTSNGTTTSGFTIGADVPSIPSTFVGKMQGVAVILAALTDADHAAIFAAYS